MTLSKYVRFGVALVAACIIALGGTVAAEPRLAEESKPTIKVKKPKYRVIDAPRGAIMSLTQWNEAGELLGHDVTAGVQTGGIYQIAGAALVRKTNYGVNRSVVASNPHGRTFYISKDNAGAYILTTHVPGGGPSTIQWLRTPAYAINDRGKLIGAGLHEGIVRAYRASSTLSDVEFAPVGEEESRGVAIANNGAALVRQPPQPGNPATRDYYWEANGALAQFIGQVNALSWDGTYAVGTWDNLATRLNLATGELIYLGAGLNSTGIAVNTRGDVLATTASGDLLLWREGTLFDLNKLVHLPSGWRLTHAWSLTDSGGFIATATKRGRTPQQTQYQTIVVQER